MKSTAIVVHKHDASIVISKLRLRDIVHPDLKIAQRGNQVFIPVISEVIGTILDDCEYIVDEFDFDTKETRPASLKEALKILIPNLDDEFYQTSYDQIGDIAVIDLNDELIRFEKKVGDAIIWSNPAMSAVYRKSHKVDGLLRLRGLHHIGGENRTRTIHKEHGIRIAVDIAKAYFSPRLATEHARIASLIPENCRVLDMFGSLAPFALHITKDKDIIVDTVDINPNVSELIKKSIKLNNLTGSINIFIEDVRNFIKRLDSTKYDHIIMNHPSGASEYLSDAIEVTKSGGKIFYYDFIEIDEYKQIIKAKMNNYDTIKIEEIHIVRQSSPHEYHVAVELCVHRS